MDTRCQSARFQNLYLSDELDIHPGVSTVLSMDGSPKITMDRVDPSRNPTSIGLRLTKNRMALGM